MKKKKNWFLRIVAILFIIFGGLYIASVSGYYDAEIRDKVAITDEAIKEFEQDIIDGKEVDIKEYVKNDQNDYSNAFSNAGENVSEVIETFINEGLRGTWDTIKVLFF